IAKHGWLIMIIKKTRVYFVFISMFFIASAFSQTAPKTASQTQYADTVISYVKFVYDGDTVLLSNNQKVRYIGIDTPETEHSKKGAQFFSKEATTYNKNLVLNKKVRLEFDIEKRDKYGRLLAYVFVDDIFVNAKLVEDGFAKVFEFQPNIKYRDLFQRLQKTAQDQKKGMWAVKP
ncbi:MAG: thermonuclease family protein, partial [Candidatus Omnitrophica bacterium]|nr:thermonuclease family protein [Candidatus Omnitrophota bacterium]